MTDDDLIDDMGLVGDNVERDAVTIPIALGVLLALIGALCVLTWAFRLLRSVLVTL